jgi:hypothetical protein
METEQVKAKIEAQARDKKITCHQALLIAEEEGIPSRAVGELLNEMGIKVVGCQLGCFP